MPLKVFTTFSGYDSQCLALDRLGIEYDLVGWSEIDKYAIKAHDALYPQYANRNFGDITKIDWNAVPDFDLLTYSSPCQDFSIAGLQQGGEKGSGTRSSLLWEVEKAIATKRPKWLLMENVAALVSHKFKPLLLRWMHTIEKYGYKNLTKVLNAKNYNIPQNRERVFVVSTLNKEPFFFPRPKPLKRSIINVLEKTVDERYFLTDAQIESYQSSSYIQNKRRLQEKQWCDTLTARDWKDPKCVCVGRLTSDKWGKTHESTRRVYSPDGISPTLNCCEGGNLQPKILADFGGVSVNPISHALEFKDKWDTEKSPALRASDYKAPHCAKLGDRIRKLTPRECFRLMDVSDSDIDKIQAAGISNSQQYKLAGNSICVGVLVDIFRKMFINRESETQQRELF
ncbi:MAG: DNA (cytosine-5-)-methyltransferase [Bacteroidales bacterium]|nr:DNA (cytosine-5-)-methyltransferase [Bacteroidales bacterium]